MDRWVTAVGALALAAAAALVGGLTVTGPPPADPQRWLPLLVMLASLCVAVLARTRSASLAYGGIILGLTTGMIEVGGLARAARAASDLGAWQWWSIAVAVVALAAVSAAASYAAGPGRGPARWIRWAAVAAVGWVMAVGAWATGDASRVLLTSGQGLGDLGLVTRSALAVVVVGVALGVIGDLRPAIARTQRRHAAAAWATDPTEVPMGLAQRQLAWLRILVEELQPGRDRAHRAVLAERSRLARELHADVAPVLHDAVREVERGGSPERIRDVLRDLAVELDDVIGREHTVHLDLGGLIPALEWLAERVEDRSSVRVAIDVADGTGSGGTARPPALVEAAAFRVARLALDNVIRHADGAAVAVDIVATPSMVRMDIRDHGPGIERGAREVAARAGRRGLVDMATEAGAVGAEVRVSTADTGPGTLVRFRWPAGS
jgi:signal transduction histidine kinase